MKTTIRFILGFVLYVVCAVALANEDSELLQACIDEGRELPHGHFKIDKPLHTAYNKSVSSIKGKGTPSLTKGQFWAGFGTYIEWVGKDDAEAMVYFESCDSELTHITLDAKKKAKNCVLFYKRRPKSGLYAPGSNTSDRLYCFNAKEAGITFGRGPGDHHCDEFVSTFYQTRGNPIGVRVRNAMSMAHRFEHVQSYTTDCDFEYQGGGYLSLQTITKLWGSTILRIREVKHPDGRATIGSGNRLYTIYEVKSDAQANSVCLLDLVTETKVNVSFNKVLLARPSNQLLKLNGPCVVTIRDMEQPILQNSMTATEGRRGFPNIALYRCNTPTSWSEMFTSGSVMSASRGECYRGDGYVRVGNYARAKVVVE